MVLAKDLAPLLPRNAYLTLVRFETDKEGNTRKKSVLWEGFVIDFPTIKEMKGFGTIGTLYIDSLMYYGTSYYMLNDVDECRRIQAIEKYFADEPASNLSKRSAQ